MEKGFASGFVIRWPYGLRGRDVNEIERARISMMARSSKAPSIGRIQNRKTNFSKSSRHPMTLPAANSHATVDARAKSGAIGRRQRRRELYRPDEDMTRAGLVRALGRLTFRDGCCLLSVDQGVRNYLIRPLQAR